MVTYSQLRPFQSLVDWCGRSSIDLLGSSFSLTRAVRFCVSRGLLAAAFRRGKESIIQR